MLRLLDPRRGQEGQKAFATAHGAAAGAAAAVRRSEGLMQVQMHAVEAHVAHTHSAHNGVHVGTIVIKQRVHGVKDAHDVLQVPFHEAEGIGAGHHHAGDVLAVLVDGRLHGGGIDDAVRRLQRDNLKAGHMGRSGVRAVSGVRNEHDVTAAALGPVVSGDEGHAGEFTVGASHGLKRETLHARDLAQPFLGLIENLKGTLAGSGTGFAELGQHGMHAGESRKGADSLGELGVILHGAGAERIEIGVNAVVQFREAGKMTHDVELTAFRHPGSGSAQQAGREHVTGFGLGRILIEDYAAGDAPGDGFVKDCFHSKPPRLSARLSICSLEFFSVQQRSRTSSMPL